MTIGKLMIKRGNGRYCVATQDEILRAAAPYQVQEVRAHLGAPDATRRFLSAQLRDRPYELFAVLWLDNRHRLIEFVELFRGTIDRASVHPREVLRSCMEHNAAACILAHNHPSGIADPSQADELITRRIKEMLGLVDVRVLDHIIVAGDQTTSFCERGLL